MSYSPENIKTAVICASQEEHISLVSSLLFKIAFSYAKKGMVVHILNNPNKPDIQVEEQYLLFPEILERIHYRYLTTSEEVIHWCHEAHFLPKKPSMILIQLDHFCTAEDFEIITICAALVDAALYLSSCEKSKQHYLLTTALIDVDNYMPFLHTFFNFSWMPTINDNGTICLKSYGEIVNSDEETFTITINNDPTHKDFKKIFEEYQKTKTNLALKV